MQPTLVVVGLAGLAGLAYKTIDFARLLTNLPATRSATLTQVMAWVAGIAATFLYGASQWGSTVVVGGLTVDRMNVATKILTGLAVGSLGSGLADARSALDQTGSTTKPALLRPRSVRPPAADSPPPAKTRTGGHTTTRTGGGGK